MFVCRITWTTSKWLERSIFMNDFHLEEIAEKLWSWWTPTFPWPRVLGKRECKPKEIILEQYTKMFESRTSAGETEKLPGVGKAPRKTVAWSCNMEGHDRKCVEWYCWQTEQVEQIYKVSSPCLDDHQFKQEELESVEIITSVLTNCFEMLVPKMNWETRHFLFQNGPRLATNVSHNGFFFLHEKSWKRSSRNSRSVHDQTQLKATEPPTKLETRPYVNRSSRNTSYWGVETGAGPTKTRKMPGPHTNDNRQYCPVDNTAQHCRLDFFQDSDLLTILRTRNKLNFVPISWMCKKQTSASHGSTKTEIILLDTELRLDGWDDLFSTFGTWW